MSHDKSSQHGDGVSDERATQQVCGGSAALARATAQNSREHGTAASTVRVTVTATRTITFHLNHQCRQQCKARTVSIALTCPSSSCSKHQNAPHQNALTPKRPLTFNSTSLATGREAEALQPPPGSCTSFSPRATSHNPSSGADPTSTSCWPLRGACWGGTVKRQLARRLLPDRDTCAPCAPNSLQPGTCVAVCGAVTQGHAKPAVGWRLTVHAHALHAQSSP